MINTIIYSVVNYYIASYYLSIVPNEKTASNSRSSIYIILL